MYLDSSCQCIKIGYSPAQCIKIVSGLSFRTLRIFGENFFRAPPLARLIFTTRTKCDAAFNYNAFVYCFDPMLCERKLR